MLDPRLFTALLYAWIALSAVALAVLLSVGAPYGRHAREGWGPTMNARVAWVLMELPSPALMLLTFATGRHRDQPWAWLFLSLWLAHYAHRALIQPFRWRGTPTPMPVAVAAMAAVFNVINGYTNGRWLFDLGPSYASGWFRDPRFVIGLAMFIGGFAVNLHADEALRNLRREGEGGYKIPRGGLYRWVSCPNYLGEMVEWAGFALCTYSLPAAAFAAWTVANLLPRAIAHHRWYRERFSDYPPERRAVIPFVL